VKTYRVLCDGANREEWLAARMQVIGASDSADVLGIGYKSALKAFAIKLGLDTVTETEAMRDGSDLEPLVVKRLLSDAAFIERFGECEWRGNRRLCQSIETPHMGATPDGTTTTEKLGDLMTELKAPGLYGYRLWDDGLPPMFNCQVQHQMYVMGESRALIAMKSHGQEVIWDLIERDDEFINGVLLPACARFWQAVQDKDPSTLNVDGSEATKEALAALHPDDDGSVIDLSGHAALFTDYDDAKAKEKEGKDTAAGLKNKIAALFGDASMASLADGRAYTYKRQDKDSYTVKASSTRVLRRKKVK